ncbi:MAG: tRNA dihydrouridine(20/20a) synthase DusA [Myxococcales bacterium]|nr:tRNA dihydrouridine(20/20a) synthase DusA [Myxococcales bacterium]
MATSPARAPAPPLSVAPMMDRTDRHFRYLVRQITRETLLYTEMITTWAILNGPRAQLLAYDPIEHPIALQVGGDDPEALARVARIAEGEGYDEINVNVGCPSDRVQSGRFGACLMLEPARVAEGVAAMRAATRIPVTVKHRIGVDERDAYEDMLAFVDTVAAAGADRFSVHARKAWLQGLSPKENRTIPPLRYDEVYRLKRERPELQIEINGGIMDLEQARAHLAHVDAVMIGRAAYDDPFLFADADRVIFGRDAAPTPAREVVEAMVAYAARHVAAGGRLSAVTRHMLGLFAGQPGARAYRRHLSVHGPREGAGPEVLQEALRFVLRDP